MFRKFALRPEWNFATSCVRTPEEAFTGKRCHDDKRALLEIVNADLLRLFEERAAGGKAKRRSTDRYPRTSTVLLLSTLKTLRPAAPEECWTFVNPGIRRASFFAARFYDTLVAFLPVNDEDGEWKGGGRGSGRYKDRRRVDDEDTCRRRRTERYRPIGDSMKTQSITHSARMQPVCGATSARNNAAITAPIPSLATPQSYRAQPTCISLFCTLYTMAT